MHRSTQVHGRGKASSRTSVEASPPALRSVLLLLLLAGVAACDASSRSVVNADGGLPGVDGDAGALPFAALGVDTYLGKVKSFLVGLPPTDAEVAQLQTDPNALKAMIQGWMQRPEYAAKMQTFFAVAFQQSQSSNTDLSTLGHVNFDNLGQAGRHLLASAHESFARTALALTSQDVPFTQTITTQSLMLNVPLMMFYAELDAQTTNDHGVTHDRIRAANPAFHFTLESSKGAISLADSLDPTSQNYLTFYEPGLAPLDPATGCGGDPLVIDAKNALGGGDGVAVQLFNYLLGANVTYGGQPRCRFLGKFRGVAPVGTVVADADWNTWRMVKIRAPKAGENPTNFWDVAAMRSATELVLTTPRVGFFTTLSFLGEWNTNDSNQARVTMSQTLITAVGHAYDGLDATKAQSLAAVDETHASNPQCFACHQTLDPMRQFFRQQYSLSFSPQTDPVQIALPGQFVFDGVSGQGTSIYDLAQQLSVHPAFAAAWVQRLCTAANSSPCSTDDPEFIRLTSLFAARFSWNTLVAELFSSPIVTNTKVTKTATDQGEIFPLSRREQLCASLSSRLKITDVCGLDVQTAVPTGLKLAAVVAASLPSDEYSRGAVAPVLVNQPSLFYRTGLENLCLSVAGAVIDGTGSLYQSSSPDAAIADFVHNLMGVTTDRDATPLSILKAHYQAALGTGASASTALKSTFVLACTSPSTAGVGL